MAPPDDLDTDGPLQVPRSHNHTHTLLDSGAFSLKELWDDYGIVGDLVVRNFLFNYF